MSEAWIVVIAVGVATVALKATGGPSCWAGVRSRSAFSPWSTSSQPVMLAPLVTTQTFGSDEEIAIDERVPGVAAAAAAVLLWRRTPVLAAMVLAARVTALARAL